MTITHLLEATVDVAAHPFTVLIDASDGAVIAGGFCSGDDLFDRLEPDERGDRAPAPDDHPVVAALRAYDAGRLDALDDLAVRQPAPPFRHEVQLAMRRVAAGDVTTYTELAAAAGRPNAVRAAGSGCATNRVALIVPCHRVRRTDGTLGGYAYGVDVKADLLRHEGAMPSDR